MLSIASSHGARRYRDKIGQRSDDGAHQQNPSASAPQLPVHWYFDPVRFDWEKQLIFDASANYVGHAKMVSARHSYRSTEWRDHATLLVHHDHEWSEVSNICRHRQAVMVKGEGSSKNIVCPLHRWAYSQKGELQAAPYFPQNPCLHLSRHALESWQGLLFRGPRSACDDLRGLTAPEDFASDDWVLGKVELHPCAYNWKTFIEVYLEDYHVVPFHPGLGRLVTCDDLTWEMGDWYSVQKVGVVNWDRWDRSPSEAYRTWQALLKNYYQSHHLPQPSYGARWLTYYPNVMVESYPLATMVSTLIPQAVNRTLNVVEFYYPRQIAEQQPALINAQQQAYMETAREDDDIAERMDAGRALLMAQGRNEVGPYQSPMEDGMRHFHEYYRAQMSPAPLVD